MKKINEKLEIKESLSEKCVEFLDRHEVLLVVFVGLLISIAFSYNNYIVPYDSLWNFGSLYKMHLGYKMYSEINIIQTPIFFWVGEVFFKLLGTNFLTYNIYNTVLIFSLFIITYLTCSELIKNKLARFTIMTLIIATYTRTCFGGNGPNYNSFSLIVIFLIILNYLKHKDNDMQKVYNGILAGLALFTYQKAGAAAVVGITIYEFITRKDLKKSLKNLIITAFSMIIVVELFLIYETKIGTINNFIDMTLLSISEFSNNFRCNLASVLAILFIYIPVIMFAFFLKKKGKSDNKLFLIISFSIGNILYSFPIMNEYHLAMGLIIVFIAGIYEFNIVFEEIIENLKIVKLNLAISAILICLLIIYSIGNMAMYLSKLNEIDRNDPFYGSIISEDTKENIEDVNAFIEEEENKGNKVKILSNYAYLYKHTFDEYNNFLDMPLTGNFGSKGTSALIDYIKGEDYFILLVQNEERSIYEMEQFPKNVREYVYENYKKIGILHNYDIYEIKNNKNIY